MNSTCGLNPARCNARMRSAANMKLPFNTATTRKSLGSAAATDRAISSLRRAMDASSNRTRTRGDSLLNITTFWGAWRAAIKHPEPKRNQREPADPWSGAAPGDGRSLALHEEERAIGRVGCDPPGAAKPPEPA